MPAVHLAALMEHVLWLVVAVGRVPPAIATATPVEHGCGS